MVGVGSEFPLVLFGQRIAWATHSHEKNTRSACASVFRVCSWAKNAWQDQVKLLETGLELTGPMASQIVLLLQYSTLRLVKLRCWRSVRTSRDWDQECFRIYYIINTTFRLPCYLKTPPRDSVGRKANIKCIRHQFEWCGFATMMMLEC